MYALTIMFSDG